MAKVQSVINKVRTAFLSSFNVHCEVAIDDAMVKFKGRSTLKQYMPNKPIKRGFKVWVRADSRIGYISDFSVYTGKDGSDSNDLGGKVVKKLTGSLVSKHHHLYFDNFFTSPKLMMLDLLEMDQYVCGTYRYTRKDVPLDIKTAALREIQRGEAIFRQHSNLVANVWRDKKLVYVMSTNSSPVMSTCNRKEKDGTVVEFPIPTSIKLYNQYMNGVDHSDQLRSYY